jgi:hypothetical protein
MNIFDELFKDNEFTLHWKACYAKLRPKLIEMQMYPPEGVVGPEDIGRRTLFLRELIEQFDKLNTLPSEGLGAPRAKKLNLQHLKSTPQANAKASSNA